MLKFASITVAALIACLTAFAANEVHVRALIRFDPDGIQIDTAVQRFDQAGSLSSMGRQFINTGAWEAVSISGFTNGYAFFCNVDTSPLAFIELATAADTNIFARLDADEFMLLPLSTNGILARCTTSTNAISGQLLKKFSIEE